MYHHVTIIPGPASSKLHTHAAHPRPAWLLQGLSARSVHLSGSPLCASLNVFTPHLATMESPSSEVAPLRVPHHASSNTAQQQSQSTAPGAPGSPVPREGSTCATGSPLARRALSKGQAEMAAGLGGRLSGPPSPTLTPASASRRSTRHAFSASDLEAVCEHSALVGLPSSPLHSPVSRSFSGNRGAQPPSTNTSANAAAAVVDDDVDDGVETLEQAWKAQLASKRTVRRASRLAITTATEDEVGGSEGKRAESIMAAAEQLLVQRQPSITITSGSGAAAKAILSRSLSSSSRSSSANPLVPSLAAVMAAGVNPTRPAPCVPERKAPSRGASRLSASMVDLEGVEGGSCMPPLPPSSPPPRTALSRSHSLPSSASSSSCAPSSPFAPYCTVDVDSGTEGAAARLAAAAPSLNDAGLAPTLAFNHLPQHPRLPRRQCSRFGHGSTGSAGSSMEAEHAGSGGCTPGSCPLKSNTPDGAAPLGAADAASAGATSGGSVGAAEVGDGMALAPGKGMGARRVPSRRASRLSVTTVADDEVGGSLVQRAESITAAAEQLMIKRSPSFVGSTGSTAAARVIVSRSSSFTGRSDAPGPLLASGVEPTRPPTQLPGRRLPNRRASRLSNAASEAEEAQLAGAPGGVDGDGEGGVVRGALRRVDSSSLRRRASVSSAVCSIDGTADLGAALADIAAGANSYEGHALCQKLWEDLVAGKDVPDTTSLADLAGYKEGGAWVVHTAPEVLEGRGYSRAADVFAFGVLMFEMLARKPLAAEAFAAKQQQGVVKEGGAEGGAALDAAVKMAGGWRPERPHAVAANVWEVVQACWAADPGARPNAAALVERLMGVLAQGPLGPTNTVDGSPLPQSACSPVCPANCNAVAEGVDSPNAKGVAADPDACGGNGKGVKDRAGPVGDGQEEPLEPLVDGQAVGPDKECGCIIA